MKMLLQILIITCTKIQFNKYRSQVSSKSNLRKKLIVKSINFKDLIMSYEIQKVQSNDEATDLAQNLELSQQFFVKMFNLQNAYQKEKSLSLLQQLLALYTDCVTYFQAGSESATFYFQNKIKELVQQHNQLFTGSSKRQGRDTFSQTVIKTMEQENIYKRIGHEMKRAQDNKKTIENIIKAQEEDLENRMRKTKRLAKTLSSRSFSSTSFSDQFSPDKRTPRKPIKEGYLIFTAQIRSQESDNQ